MFSFAMNPDGCGLRDSDVAVLAKDVLARYSQSHLLLDSFRKACGKRKPLLRASRELELARSRRDSQIASFQNKHMKEFLGIVSFGVETGADVEKALTLFIGNLEREILFGNRIRAKIGSTQALTRIGMGVFFPLFSGISAVIISSSLGVVDSGAPLVYAGFLAVSMAYVPIILYLSSAFAHPERNVKQNAVDVAPYVALAALITYSTQTLIGSIL